MEELQGVRGREVKLGVRRDITCGCYHGEDDNILFNKITLHNCIY